MIIPLKIKWKDKSRWALSFHLYKQRFLANQVSISSNMNSINTAALMRDVYYEPRNRAKVKSLLKNIL